MVLPKVIGDAVAGARGPTLIKVHAHIMYFVLPIPPEVDRLSESSLVVHHLIACTVTAIRSLQPRANPRVEVGRVGSTASSTSGPGLS
jgi:hypothetical protein